MSEDQNNLFVNFNEHLNKIFETDLLKDVSRKSPQTLQVLTFHLACEYMLAKWVDFKINEGKEVFKGIEKIGFHNKLYIAKNIGFPKDLFEILNKLNDIRNKFAHDPFEKNLNNKKLDELVKEVDKAQPQHGNEISKLSTPDKVSYINVDIKDTNSKMFFVLQSIFWKTRSYIFVDISRSLSNSI
jgi:hypothetical protein